MSGGLQDIPGLPTFEDVRRQARNRLSDARDWLASDRVDQFLPSGQRFDARRPSDRQVRLLLDALDAINEARSALDKAAIR